MITNTVLGRPVSDTPTDHDWKPTHPVHERPAYLVQAMAEEERLGKELVEAADRHEMADINDPAPTMLELQRLMREYNRACFRLQQARERHTEEQRRYYEYQEEDAREWREMTNELRHGG